MRTFLGLLLAGKAVIDPKQPVMTCSSNVPSGAVRCHSSIRSLSNLERVSHLNAQINSLHFLEGLCASLSEADDRLARLNAVVAGSLPAKSGSA
jgi:hypothetical protein